MAVFRVALAAALLVWLFQGLEAGKLHSLLLTADFLQVALAVACIVGYALVTGFRWSLFGRTSGLRAGGRTYLAATFRAMLANQLLPSGLPGKSAATSRFPTRERRAPF